MMTLVGGGELFTGNTALVTAAVIEKKAEMKDLVKNWFFSYGGNFVGSLLMAYLAFQGATLGNGPAAVLTANMKVSYPFKTLFIRGVLCNWLVCMAVYMASGCTSLISKMVAIWFPISAFIALGLDHSIANMFLIPLGIMRGAPITVADFLTKNLLPVTLGNIVGGAGCVAMGYSAAYGSLLDRPKASESATKALSMRGGFVSTTKVTRTTMKMVTANELLKPETLERAKVGNNIEKMKQKKDPTQLWTDVHEFAAAIRAGQTNW
jgi:formate/nitrite transporter